MNGKETQPQEICIPFLKPMGKEQAYMSLIVVDCVRKEAKNTKNLHIKPTLTGQAVSRSMIV